MTEESFGKRLVRLLVPELIYLGMCLLVEVVGGVFWAYRQLDTFVSDTWELDTATLTEQMTEMLYEYAVLLQSIAAFICIFVLLRMYFKDYKKRRFIFNKTTVKKIDWLLLIPAGIFASLAGNLIMNISDVSALYEGFEESQKLLFSGPYLIQLVGIGVIIPICEELIYRGLVYMRMRQYMDVNKAICWSALMFGIFHGNLIQGLYAFVVGILFAYAYEKYGSLKAPILLHVTVNLLSLGLSVFSFEIEQGYSLLLPGVLALTACLCIVHMIDKKVTAERIYMSKLES